MTAPTKNRPAPTPTEMAACYFVAALAQDVDARRGVVAEDGTPETRTKVIDLVRERFFGDRDAPA